MLVIKIILLFLLNLKNTKKKPEKDKEITYKSMTMCIHVAVYSPLPPLTLELLD